MIKDKCYKYRTRKYSNGTCINIGGYYAVETVPPYHYYCYYSSFNCRYHKINGQCYSRSSHHSQTLCQTIPGSYFDVSNNTCYYYCTEMPKLRQCFVADNSSFTRETCALLGGVFAYNTCYYVSLRCHMYNTSSRQCYTNRSVALTCSTCRNIGGHYENGFCYYYQYNCSAYRIDGQCYSTRKPLSVYTSHYCQRMGGTVSSRYCYYDLQSSNCKYYRSCQCYSYAARDKMAGTCWNIGGYYDAGIQLCFYNSSACPYYEKNRQCYTWKNSNFSRETCSVIGGYFEFNYGTGNNYEHSCYYFNYSCNYMVNNQCYLMLSSAYHEATCASIGGYYSQNHSACYYNYFSCSYPFGGQCYDTHIPGWSRQTCEEANGNYSFSALFSTCYISRFYCRYIFNSTCYRFISTTFDCSSCRLLRGHFQSRNCYHTKNCSEPLLLASNGQCYGNHTTARTAAECRSMPGNSFYDSRNAKCYFTTGLCSSGRYVNCQCFIHSSTVYNNGSCSNFGGQYLDDTCYYNSSYCPYHSFEGQCYRHFRLYNLPDMCLNIGGHYVFPPSGSGIASNVTSTVRTSYVSSSLTVGTCYYNSFNCSGFILNRYFCYSNRSATYSSATCRNIGGERAYRSSDGSYSTHRGSFSSYLPYCLYNTFNCLG